MLSLAQTITRAVQINGNHLATTCNNREHTWAEVADRIARMGNWLVNHGVGTDSRVAILGLNSDRYYELFFSPPWAGGISVPINTRLALPEIVYWLTDSASQVLFIDDDFLKFLPEIRQQVPAIQHVVYMGEGEVPEGLFGYEKAIVESTPMLAADRHGDDIAGLYYTGGTTGRSKGVMLSHNNLLFNSLQSLSLLKYDIGDMYLNAAPMFHIAGSLNVMIFTTIAGSNCFVPSFNPEVVMGLIEKHQVKRTLLVPTMINMIVNHPNVANYDLSSVKTIIYGASPMPEAVITRAMEILPGTGFFQAFGQTESSPVLTMLPPEYHVTTGPNASKLKAAGRAVPGVTLAIMDENDQELPRGTVGQICAKGGNVMVRYQGMPEVTEETKRNGWLHTGDGGYMDEDGFLFVVDRIKDMIISGGENVYSVEVENAIFQHPNVAECAVIGIPHAKWGEQVHAIVCLKEAQETTEQEIIDHCKQLIATFKCPRSITIRSEPLPLSGAGKILKKDLRSPYWEGQGKQVH